MVGGRLRMMAWSAVLMLLVAAWPATGAIGHGKPPKPACSKATAKRHKCPKPKPKKPKPKPHKQADSQGGGPAIDFQDSPETGTGTQTKPADDGDTKAPPPNPPADPTQACPDTTLEPSAGNFDQVRASVLCLINQARAQNGNLGALTLSAPLQKAGDDYTAQMVREGFFSHNGPDGSDPSSRAAAAGYAKPRDSFWIGEDLAAGQPGADTPAALVDGWMNSSAHRAVLLDARYREFGLGMADQVPRSEGGGPGVTYAGELGVRGGGGS